MNGSTSTKDRGGFGRRSFLAGGLGALTTIALPGSAMAAGSALATPAAARLAPRGGIDTLPVPPVIRSLRELESRGVVAPLSASTSALPITSDGITFQMAQDSAWLDADHFAIGRWDGSMSVFEYGAAMFGGPLIHQAVSSPAFAGVRMVAALPGGAIATSNDNQSIVLWASPSGQWTDLDTVKVYSYDPALGAAVGALWVHSGAPSTLAVGHTSGFLSIWTYRPQVRRLSLQRTVDLRNPDPVNPWGLHDLYGVAAVATSQSSAVLATGGEDGYVSIVEVPSGTIRSQTVFNPDAERGINDVSVQAGELLVANCSVGSDDHNLWYFSIDPQTWGITLLDKANLIIDTDRIQAFNFHTVWGEYSGGRCWFASTEEGALWMGTVTGGALDVFGFQHVTSPLGSTLAYRGDPGRLAMVAYDLYQYSTGAA
jgi:hypothetical protein